MNRRMIIALVFGISSLVCANAATPMTRIQIKHNRSDRYYNHCTARDPVWYLENGNYSVLFEGVNFYGDTGGSVPLYECFRPVGNRYDFFSSANASELTPGAVGYISTYIKSSGRRAIQRWFNPSTVDHMNTTFENLSGSGYYFEGNLGYE